MRGTGKQFIARKNIEPIYKRPLGTRLSTRGSKKQAEALERKRKGKLVSQVMWAIQLRYLIKVWRLE